MNLPEQRKAGSTELEIQVTLSLAVSMLDALPYLIDYPYGCTEQTLSRFVPAMIVRRTLEDLGVRAEDVAARSFWVGSIQSRWRRPIVQDMWDGMKWMR